MKSQPEPRTTWGAGDYPAMAQRLDPVARNLVAALAIGPGERAVDLACGTGNAALAAAAAGASVVGVDAEPALLAVARQRAAERELDVSWVDADVTATGLPDAGFDVAVSTFGVMYAQPHDRAAAELARLLRPGGRLGLVAWTPGSFMPRLGGTVAPFVPPPPPGGAPPAAWGDRGQLAGLLEPHGLALTRVTSGAVTLELPSVDAAVAFLVDTAGHVVAERDRLEHDGRWGDLVAAVRELVRAERVDDGRGGDGVLLRLDFLEAHGAPTSP